MKNTFRILGISFISLFIAVALSSCATMFGDNSRAVTVNSIPMGATIKVNGNVYGQTNSTIILPRYLYGISGVTLMKKGYQPTRVTIETSVNWSTLWNLLNGWGFIVDAATGDIIGLQSKTITGTLVPQS